MNSEKSLLFAGLVAILYSLTGCQSAREPGSSSHASVQINGHSLQEILQTTAAVFGEEGYSPGMSSDTQMVFERPGNRRDAAKWGGWSGEGVTMVVKVAFRELAGGSHLVQADAYARQNASDSFFQTESRNLRLNRFPYQQLLDEVRRRLKAP